MLTEAHYNFLKKNSLYLQNVKAERELITYFFSIYNELTGENKPVTGCGRCVLNVKKRLKIEILKYEEFHGIQNN
mgnify:CR=1 FL=1|jgi:hypothetical protein